MRMAVIHFMHRGPYRNHVLCNSLMTPARIYPGSPYEKHTTDWLDVTCKLCRKKARMPEWKSFEPRENVFDWEDLDGTWLQIKVFEGSVLGLDKANGKIYFIGDSNE